ncbi:MAG: L-2-hydroxyglutarate oxidase [Bifidobacteriaceae bacterium]|nr:L-2-hydroxyglutarate oxidase [Bifidobacteriaceae bacterium]
MGAKSVAVIGGGIVGLAVAARLVGRGDGVIVIEKEPELGAHQTGRNSGVIHAGVYYEPGGLKARLSRAGSASMKRFAAEHGVPYQTTGKLIVATSAQERGKLADLARRAEANGIEARQVDAAEARDIEPHVAAVEAIHIPETGIIDYAAVCGALAELIRSQGGTILTEARFDAARTVGEQVRIRLTDGAKIVAGALVNCAGLQSDQVARACGMTPSARIIPFRGEYYQLTEDKRDLVRGLIYPVPDPRFPFLGVHWTRMISGAVYAGPNAVLAMAREGYTWLTVSPRDLLQELTWPGLWALVPEYGVAGVQEMIRSLVGPLFAASAARLLPGVTMADLTLAPAGVRAQAVDRRGQLVDDFLIESGPRQLHVLNAPSPAATASLEIAKHLVAELDGLLD